MAENHSFLHRLLNWNKKNTPETVDAEQYAAAFAEFKKLLLEQYQIRVKAKMAERLPIKLSAKPTHFGTSPERSALYFDDLTIESQDIATGIDKILNTHQRLLLIGDPGAGKTTILLFAAINILMDERGEQKLPLILNLATWQSGNNFKEWYAQSIAHAYGLSSTFVEELLRYNAIVPFFDGFDEVAEDSRANCFSNMAAYFGDQRSRQLIVSSRKKEYAAAKADAPVYAEIEVQPLPLNQIQKALFENGQTYKGDLALLFALDRDEHLAKAVETPFYLNTASFLFAKSERTIFDFPFNKDSVEGRQQELVQIFVEEQIPEVRDREYLSFLARKMEEEKFLVFELVKMQPLWYRGLLEWRVNFSIIGLIFSCILLLPIFVLDCFFSDNNPDFVFEKEFEMFLILIFLGLIFSVVIAFLSSDIRTKELQYWSWHEFRKNWIKAFIRSTTLSIKISFYLSIVLSIFMVIFSWGNMYNFMEFISNIIAFALLVLFNCLITTILISLPYSLRDAGTKKSILTHISSPYKRFKFTFSRYLWLFFSLTIVTLFSYSIEMVSASNPTDLTINIEDIITTLAYIIFWMVLYLMIPLFLSQLPQHFILRLILYNNKLLPLRLVTFLDRMTDQHIFEDNRRTINGKKQRGATWRFRHKILQDYFAKLT